MNFFRVIFQGFCYILGTLKEHLWMAASVYFNREVSQGNTYFLWKYYSREYINVKIPRSKLFKRSTCFLEGGLFLVKKYWRSSYFSVKNYCGALFSGEYLLTITPVTNQSASKAFRDSLHFNVAVMRNAWNQECNPDFQYIWMWLF